jgi:hypothetical protein
VHAWDLSCRPRRTADTAQRIGPASRARAPSHNDVSTFPSIARTAWPARSLLALVKQPGVWCSVIPRWPGSGWPGTAGGCAGLPCSGRSPASVGEAGQVQNGSTGVHGASHHDRCAGAAPPRCLGGARITIIGSLSQDDHEIRAAAFRALSRDHRRDAAPLVLRYHPGVTRGVWRVAQLRLRRGCEIIVVDTMDVATLKSGMQWCENAARNEGCSRSVAT